MLVNKLSSSQTLNNNNKTRETRPDSKLLQRITAKNLTRIFDEAIDFSSRKQFANIGSDSPEQSLWRMILLQALEDSLTNSKKPESRSHKRKAQAWIFTDNEDYLEVCENSGVDPIKFRAFAYRKQKRIN